MCMPEDTTHTPTADEVIELEQLLAAYPSDSYVDTVIQLAEASQRGFTAAVNAGHVVNGFATSTNY